ncbi:DUF1648 domain-containing protein [Microbacterium sp. H83]|uniref:DUF1648 domain-containing protein n=1 Tax=Microbacterium sp. H83 TaxID=1827324 RepID=UPI0007F455C9|nr:DUF1648 domain-containing protein [Microbacterium sp. H83]OAN33669.1 hypothetical protein A4X16_06695 [Microbacterium sp. H83]
MNTPRTDAVRQPEVRRARRIFVIVAVLFPLVVTAIGIVLLLGWLPSFPDPVAIHWGVGGADGFAPASAYLWLLLAVGLGIPLLLVIATLVSVGTQWGGAARLLGAFAAGMSIFALALSLGSLAVQRDLGPDSEVPGIGGVMGLAFAGFLGVGALAWAVQPRVRTAPGRSLAPRQDVRVAAGERVVWLATATMPLGALVFLATVLAGLVALAVFMVTTGIAGGWVVAVVAVVVTVAIAATASYRIRVTPEGFSARAVIGRPRIEIPLAEVEHARAVDISPFGEFGGWGWRVSVDGRSGIVMRRGPAIEIARRGRGAFIVTVDGAEEAAALLQAYADRAARAA